VPDQPLLDLGCLVGGVVVQDQVQVQVLGDGGADDLQEAEELLVAVAAVGLCDDRAARLGTASTRMAADTAWLKNIGPWAMVSSRPRKLSSRAWAAVLR
jgi:hypothetical protein